MTEWAEIDVEDVGSPEAGEDPDRTQAGWISGLQWGPWEGMKTAKATDAEEKPDGAQQTLPVSSKTRIV